MLEQKQSQTAAYAGYSKNDDVRFGSSSGGIFFELAKSIICKGGGVVGCAFDAEFMAEHILVDNLKDLERLRGSKYLQSRMGNVYQQCIDFIKSGRYVLFSGAPCQVEGMAALGERKLNEGERKLLLLVDFVCHGAPPAVIWKKYIGLVEDERGSLESVSFRTKLNGWRHYHMSYKSTDGNAFSIPHGKDPYMVGFLNDIYLRDSCYQCKYRKLERNSDLTLADFWGIEKIFPEFDKEDKGSSLIFSHSEKGRAALESISEEVCLLECEPQKAVQGNPSALRSPVRKKKKQELFYREFESVQTYGEFKRLIDKCVHRNIIIRLYYFVKRVIKFLCRKLMN